MKVYRQSFKGVFSKEIKSIPFSVGKLFFLEKGMRYKGKPETIQNIYKSFPLEQTALYTGVCVVTNEAWDVEPIWANTSLVPENYICGVKMILENKKIVILKKEDTVTILEFEDSELISFERVKHE